MRSLRIHSAIASWIHNYFDNVMTKFMINNRLVVSAGLPVAARNKYYGIGLVVKHVCVKTESKVISTVFNAAWMWIKQYYRTVSKLGSDSTASGVLLRIKRRQSFSTEDWDQRSMGSVAIYMILYKHFARSCDQLDLSKILLWRSSISHSHGCGHLWTKH